MSEYPENLRYTKEHEWVRVEGDNAVCGITDFAQSELGEVVFVELPAVGKVVKKGDTLCVVESTKAASDVYAPIAGKVIEVNQALNDEPSMINSQPYSSGWLVKLAEFNSSEVDGLMAVTEYRALIKS